MRPVTIASLFFVGTVFTAMSAGAQTQPPRNLFHVPPPQPAAQAPEPTFAERVEQVRGEAPDLARVLRLDAGAEQRLLELLAPQDNPLEIFLPLRAEGCTRRVGELAKLLDQERLESFLDYRASLRQRREVERFDAALPIFLELTAEQKDAMTAILHAHVDHHMQATDGFLDSARLSYFTNPDLAPNERARRKLTANIAMLHEAAARTEAVNRELLAELQPVLNVDQLRWFAVRFEPELKAMRNLESQFRRELGIGDEEKVALPIPPLDSKLILRIELSINDTQVVEALISERGAPVRFHGPLGLTVEVAPYLTDVDRLRLKLNFYEPGRRQPRLLLRSDATLPITNPRQREQQEYPATSSACGRQAYSISWRARANFQ